MAFVDGYNNRNSSSNLCHDKYGINTTKWCPLHPVDVNTLTVGRYAVVILNQPILLPEKLMINIWNDAMLRMTVDGGTTQWYHFCEKVTSNLTCLDPHIVSGDFDSLPQAVIDIVQKKGTEVIHTDDQNFTDFTKALRIVQDRCKEIDSVIAVAENGGRLDQTLANINTHFTFNSEPRKSKINLYSLASDALTWLLSAGKHSIYIPQRLRDKSVWCSLLPVGGACTVSTSGLRFNLCNHTLRFGGIVSTSNTYAEEPEVLVETDNNIVWSMGLGFQKH